MNNWIAFLWQSNLCLLVFFLGYILWLSKEKCFNYRRIYLVAGSFISLLLPLIPFPDIASWLSNGPFDPTFSIILPDLLNNSGFAPGWRPTTLLIGVYILVCLVFGSIMLYKVWKTISLINRCDRSSDIYRGHTLYLTQGHFPSSSYFNFLLWDNTGDTDELHKRLILDHEIIHIQQGHSYDIMFLEFLKVVFWFNPAVWHLLKELRNVHEFIADYQVVDTTNRQLYTKFLARQTLKLTNIPWVHHFNKNLTLNRINMIHASQQSTSTWKYGILVSIYLLLHGFVSCTEEQPFAETQTDAVLSFVDEQPYPINGMETLYQEIGSKLKYPKQARRMGIEGKVFVEFVVKKSGKITNIRVLKGIGAGCDEAAKTVMAGIEDWNPGIFKGQAVAVKMVIPIIFKLNQEG
jgi:TonB family protein